MRALLTPRRWEALLDGPVSPLDDDRYAAATRRRFARARALDPFNAVSYLELTGYMSSTLLRDADAMSMAHGLELRVPLVDHRVVEHVLRLPGALKARGRRPKALLVRAAGARLSPEAQRGAKRGFTPPLDDWLRDELRHEVAGTLADTRLIRSCGLEPAAVWDVWTRFRAGEVSWMPPWSLYVLLRWLDAMGALVKNAREADDARGLAAALGQRS